MGRPKKNRAIFLSMSDRMPVNLLTFALWELVPVLLPSVVFWVHASDPESSGGESGFNTSEVGALINKQEAGIKREFTLKQ